MIEEKIPASEQNIQNIIGAKFLSQPKYVIENLYVFEWESDMLLKTNSGYWYEFEIKISVSDFKHDFVKTDKHEILSCGQKKIWYGKWEKGEKVEYYEHANRRRPNYFYYAVPSEMVDKVKDMVPEYAGLISIDLTKRHAWDIGDYSIVKKAPLLHKEKYDDNDLNLIEKFYYRWRDAIKSQRNYNDRLNELRYQIRSLKAEFKAVTGYDVSENL